MKKQTFVRELFDTKMGLKKDLVQRYNAPAVYDSQKNLARRHNTPVVYDPQENLVEQDKHYDTSLIKANIMFWGTVGLIVMLADYIVHKDVMKCKDEQAAQTNRTVTEQQMDTTMLNKFDQQYTNVPKRTCCGCGRERWNTDKRLRNVIKKKSASCRFFVLGVEMGRVSML